LFRSEICFRTTQELEYLYFCRAQSAIFSPQNLTLGYMIKTLNPIFFSLHQNPNIFFSNIANWNIFFFKKKTIIPPRQAKWSVPNQMYILYIWVEANLCFCFVYICIALNIHLSRGEIPFTGRGVIVVTMIVGFTTTCAISV
jgi:hypothetical protein